MASRGASAVIVPPFLTNGVWYVEVKGSGSTAFRLTSNPLTLEISSFGTLTANFKSAITPEVYIFAIGGIVGATSVFVGWYYKYGQRRYINRYLTRIQSTYDTLHEEDKQQCILELQSIRRELLYLYKKGSLSDSHYNILDKKTADYIEIVRDERVSS